MKRIGRYEVDGRIGAGGFATVYKVRDTVLDSEVAAKVLAENWTDSNEIRERFIREAQLLRRIDSHRVVTVHDIGEIEGGQPYFVMSLANRGTLEDRLNVGGLAPGPADVTSLAAELAACVRDVHAHELIHRDIKPSNLLVTGGRESVDINVPPLIKPSERLLLGDFGLAKDIALQATGLTIAAGTGGYAAPEQMSHGGAPSRQTDLYAATAVMYRVLTGINPPNYDLLREQVPFPDGEWWMAGPLGQFFRQGMAFDQTARHDSVDEWLADFTKAYGGQQTVVPLASTSPAPAATPAPNSNPAPMVPPSTPAVSDFFSSVPPLDDQSQTSVLAQQPVIPSPTASQPIYHAPATPQVSMPQVSAPAGQVPQTWPQGGQNVDPRYNQGGAAQYQQPQYQQPQYQQPQYQQPQYQQSGHPQANVGPHPPVRSKSRWPWLVVLVLLAAAGVAGAVFVPPLLATPTIAGPDVITAGDRATYSASFQGADSFRWTDWNGEVSEGPEFSFRGVVPGPVRFKVQPVENSVVGRAATKTVQITAAPDGPAIVGPSEIKIGVETTFTADIGDATDPEWRDDNGVEFSETHTITASKAGSFEITLIVTDADGAKVGTRRTIQFVE